MDCNFLLKRTDDGKVKSHPRREVTGMSDVDKAIYALVFIVLNLFHLKKYLLSKETLISNWETQVKRAGQQIISAQRQYLLTKEVLVVKPQKRGNSYYTRSY